MKYSFYCLPLRKHVKAKITAIVKKRSYSVKGVHKEGGKEYNLNKVVGKAEAERISKETGIDIDEGQMVAAAEEFLPEGSGHVIGQNTAGMETAIEGTEETVTANTTPFRSESPDPTDDDDKIGPMSMAAEKKNCGCGQDPCKTYGAEGELSWQDHGGGVFKLGMTPEPMGPQSQETGGGATSGETESGSQHQQEEQEAGREHGDSSQSDSTHGAEVDEAGDIVVETVEETPMESTGYETFVVSEEHWDKVYQHPEWDDEITEMVHVYRNSDGIAIQVPHPFADDVLEMIIATQDMPMDAIFNSEAPSTRSSLLGLGIGIIGLAAAFALYRRYDKEE